MTYAELPREMAVEKLKVLGRALARRGLQSSHSGNYSLRAADGDSAGFAITGSGSAKGALTDADFAFVFDDSRPPVGAQPSIEVDSHRAIYSLPGMNCVIHAHAREATALTLNAKGSLAPVDPCGIHRLGEVPILALERPCGPGELPGALRRAVETSPAAVVRSHGVFSAADTVETALRHLDILEYSAKTIRLLLSANLAVAPPPEVFMPGASPAEGGTGRGLLPGDVIEVRRYLFEASLSPFGTGLVSWDAGGDILACPGASAAKDLVADEAFVLSVPDMLGTHEAAVHKIFHDSSGRRAVVSAFTPEIEVAARLALKEGREVILPIDTEGAIREGRITVLAPDTDKTIMGKTLVRESLVAVAGGCVFAAGPSVWEAIKRLSGLRDTACYILSAHARGLDTDTLAAQLEQVRRREPEVEM